MAPLTVKALLSKRQILDRIVQALDGAPTGEAEKATFVDLQEYAILLLFPVEID